MVARAVMRAVCWLGVGSLCVGPLFAQPAGVRQGAWWELRMLGVTDSATLARLRAAAGRRRVVLAIVGTGGISRSRRADRLDDRTTFEYCDGARDPGPETHDTSAARVILDLTGALHVPVHLRAYHPSGSYRDVANAFAKAGAEADVCVLFQSFWGPNTTWLVASIRESKRALFISPYVEVGQRPTRTAVQGECTKPWEKSGISHFVTAAPISRRAPGKILTPLSRAGRDTEVITFLAPSFYASSAGGTCPAAETTAAVAVYAYSALARKPDRLGVIDLMRQTSVVDEAALTAVPEFDNAAVASLRRRIAALSGATGGTRKLDAPGVLNVYRLHQSIATTRPTR